jgi:hypothetical protein
MPYEFLPIKRSILTGSMYREGPETKWLLLVMLFESTEGMLTATVLYLARVSGLDRAEVESALEALQKPDPDSTSLQAHGRRIEVVPDSRNTYRIVNFAKYSRSPVKGTVNRIGAVVDPDTGEPIPRLLPNGKRNPAYDCRRKQSERIAKRAEQASDDRDVHSVHSAHEKKENEAKRKRESPPKPPRGRTGVPVRALMKGDLKNAETWAAFDAVYPRPDNGRKLQRADARLTWDLLAEDGEDMVNIVEGARVYREWIELRQARKYVAMMTTWLNERRWEESYSIDLSSEDGQRIQAEKYAETRERRSAHQAKFAPAYDAYVEALAVEAIVASGFYEAWRAAAEAILAKRTAMAMSPRAIEATRPILEDPEAARADQLRRWKELNAVSIPGFWEWDAKHNAETRD